MTELFGWLRTHDTAFWWLGITSALTFVGTLILVPLLLVRIPADYFLRPQDHHHGPGQHPVLRLCAVLLKNLLGMTLVLAGIAMLVLPGQGVVTILLGLMLMNFPGKQALERRIVSRPAVLRAINWIRAQAQHPPLDVPPRP